MNAQILSVMAYLRKFANDTVIERSRDGETVRSSGVLRISERKDKAGMVSLTRLKTYLGQFGITSENICQAIVALSAVKGPKTSAIAHVVIVTPERRAADYKRAQEANLTNMLAQEKFYQELFSEAGITVVSSFQMPTFDPKAVWQDGADETVQ